jgi:hypothetical protein
MIRLIFRLFLWLLPLMLAWFILGRLDILPGIDDLFTKKQLKIDETPILVKEIRGLAEMATVTSFDEVVVDSVFADPAGILLRSITGFGDGYNRLVLVVSGKVVAGTDLSALTDSSFYVFKDSVRLTLPGAKVLQVTVNPSDVSTFKEEGKWSTDAFEKVKIKAREKMRDRAMQQGIIGRADKRSVAIMERFLSQAGFKKVKILLL